MGQIISGPLLILQTSIMVNVSCSWQSHWKKRHFIFIFDGKIEYIIQPMLILVLDM